jgi:hypothetical protein
MTPASRLMLRCKSHVVPVTQKVLMMRKLDAYAFPRCVMMLVDRICQRAHLEFLSWPEIVGLLVPWDRDCGAHEAIG